MTTVAQSYAGTSYSFSELNDMSNDHRSAVLANSILMLDEQIKALQEKRKEASNFLMSSMPAGATKMVVGDLKVGLEESYKWEYEPEELIKLTAFGITQEEYDACVKPTVKVDKAMLNAFKSRGDSVVRIIDAACQRIVTSSRVVVERKKAVKEKATPRVFSEHERGPAEW